MVEHTKASGKQQLNEHPEANKKIVVRFLPATLRQCRSSI